MCGNLVKVITYCISLFYEMMPLEDVGGIVHLNIIHENYSSWHHSLTNMRLDIICYITLQVF